MKKKYEKPVIVFEKFTLSTSISAGCDKRVTTLAENACGIPDTTTGMFVVFSEAMAPTCNLFESDDEYDGFCYHVSAENAGQLFNS